MQIETFELERRQSLWENRVTYNLTESGMHPFRLDELLEEQEQRELLSLQQGYGQTNGDDVLREKITDWYEQASDINQVLVTNGSAEANFLMTHSLLEPGDELVYLLPNYQQIWGLARANGVHVKPVRLVQHEDSWALDGEALKRAVTPQTKIIAVCNPDNPTGHVFTDEEMDLVIELAEQNDALVYADEVYRGAEVNGQTTTSFLDKTSNAVVAGGLSKAFALPGLRIGWLAGPEEVIAECWRHRDYTSICSSLVSQFVARKAMDSEMRDQIFDRNRSLLHQNSQLFDEWVQSHSDHLSWIPPKAGGMAFVRYDWDINSTKLTERFRDEQDVLVVAGDCFGMDGYLRFGIGAESDYLQEGLKRVDQVLNS